MIKGLAITPPILGRISIGKMVEKNGKRIPEKDDQFTITSQIQNKEGWVKHPLDEQLRAKAPNQKLRSIPVRMIFNDPELNLRAEYSLFDRQTGRPVCVGNGETCRRLTNQGVEHHPCPSPDLCQWWMSPILSTQAIREIPTSKLISAHAHSMVFFMPIQFIQKRKST